MFECRLIERERPAVKAEADVIGEKNSAVEVPDIDRAERRRGGDFLQVGENVFGARPQHPGEIVAGAERKNRQRRVRRVPHDQAGHLMHRAVAAADKRDIALLERLDGGGDVIGGGGSGAYRRRAVFQQRAARGGIGQHPVHPRSFAVPRFRVDENANPFFHGLDFSADWGVSAVIYWGGGGEGRRGCF